MCCEPVLRPCDHSSQNSTTQRAAPEQTFANLANLCKSCTAIAILRKLWIRVKRVVEFAKECGKELPLDWSRKASRIKTGGIGQRSW